MNVEMLQQIKMIIKSHPTEFDMWGWHVNRGCGTTHCIAGWADVLSGVTREDGRDVVCIFRRGDALNLDEDQRYRLFYDHQWPKRFRDGSVESACARIDHFIATDGRE